MLEVNINYHLQLASVSDRWYHHTTSFFFYSPNYLSWQQGRQLTTGCKTHPGTWGSTFLSSINKKTFLLCHNHKITYMYHSLDIANLSLKMWYLIWSGASSKCNRRSLWWAASSYIYCSPQTLRDKLYHKLLPTNQPTNIFVEIKKNLKILYLFILGVSELLSPDILIFTRKNGRVGAGRDSNNICIQYSFLQSPSRAVSEFEWQGVGSAVG